MFTEKKLKSRLDELHLVRHQKKAFDRMKKRRAKEDDPLCEEWECQEGCVPCIPSICSKFSEIRGKCETCKQQNWVICLHDLRKIPPELLV